MTICSPEAGNIVRGRSPRVILHVEGEQNVMLPSDKGNNCLITPTCHYVLLFLSVCRKKRNYIVSFAVTSIIVVFDKKSEIEIFNQPVLNW